MMRVRVPEIWYMRWFIFWNTLGMVYLYKKDRESWLRVVDKTLRVERGRVVRKRKR